MNPIVVLGGITYDTVVSMSAFPEPKSATLYARAIGSDLYGQKTIDYFKREGLSFHPDIDPAGTERHVNLMDQEGGRISIFLNTTPADVELNLPLAEQAVIEADYVVLNIIGYCKQYIPLIQRRGKEIWCDLHDYNGVNPYYDDYIDASHYLFLSSDNLPDYRALMEKWIFKDGKKLVVCTQGKEGATALTSEGQWIEVPIVPHYRRIDTNGAGDNFFSGFLYAYSHGLTIEKSLQAAAIAAGLCITSKELVYEQLSAAKLAADYREHFGVALF